MTKQPLETKGPVHIGRHCFIGISARILENVTLGEGCIVGANSVVNKSFPAFSMIGDAPARLLRVFDHTTRAWVKPLAQATHLEADNREAEWMEEAFHLDGPQ